MENKINVAELLKDCPKGMELDCLMYDGVTLNSVISASDYPITITTKSGFSTRLTKYGQNVRIKEAKCVIFPKGKTTWEGFVPPCKFKDGDVVFTTLGNIAIIRKPIGGELFYVYGIMVGNGFYKDETVKVIVERPATEEEKEKLFQAIKDNGYKWNTETKTLEKLIIPKFKVGDIVRSKNCIDAGNFIIVGVEENSYSINIKNYCIEFKDQDNYELVPNKFDITTLKPFDKVLARCSTLEKWRIQLFEKYDKTCKYPFICMGYNKYKQCIPYESNGHLLDTANNCDDYYKTWE